ncbi:hypothetical protein [Streptomyces spiramyceticus]|uniref:hypothetical protein n=1 Tax=Streptomyces spiramyceticus TaxID=299717 RepID=UPI00237A4716|nr:hypothetical protein [Streptomyces spiramyceticus]
MTTATPARTSTTDTTPWTDATSTTDTTATPDTTARTTVAPPAPRWARRTAHAIVLCAVPSGLWRLAMASGIYVGYSDEVLRDAYGIPGWGIAYVVGLAIVQECAALVPLLLVSDRRRLPRPRAVAGAAGAISLLVTLFALSQLVLLFFVEGDQNMSGNWNILTGLCYAPLFAVGPLLGAVTWSYRKRHRA